MIALAEAIYDDLTTHVGILEIITASDIYWIEPKEKSSVNRIIYKRISDVPVYDSDDRQQRWRFYVQHADKHECERLAEVLYNYLHRKDDTFDIVEIDYVSCVQNNDPVFIQELNAFEVIQDYLINFH